MTFTIIRMIAIVFPQRTERKGRARSSIGEEGIARKQKFSVGRRPTMSMAFPDS